MVNVDAMTGQLVNGSCGGSSAHSYPYITGSQPKATASCGGSSSSGFYVPPELGNDTYAPPNNAIDDELPTNF